MNIKLVKLKNGGFNGAEVHYFVEEIKGSRKSHTLIKKFPKDPIHKDLENLFKDLRPHLLNICHVINDRMDETEIKFKILETTVTGVDFDSDGFTLHGEYEVFGNKAVKPNVPKVEEIDQYEHYEEVVEIIKNIITEAKLYLEGEKKVSDEELTQRWIEAGKDKSMSMDTFNGLSLEEQRDFATNLLENKFGSIIIHNNDHAEDLSVVVEEDQSFVIGDDEEVIIPVTEVKKKGKPAPKETINESETEEF